MAIAINTNIASLNAQRNLSTSQLGLNKSMQRLSSGLRINSAKDDAAGLAISDRMTSQIRGLNQAARNAQDGISMAQTAEGALGETTNLLQRMRELAVQSANDTNTEDDRKSLQAEFTQLMSEIERIAGNTQFNNRGVLNGSAASGAIFHIGANADQTITLSINSMGVDGLGVNSTDTGTVIGTSYTLSGTCITASGINSFNVSFKIGTQSGANAAITVIDTAIGTVDTERGKLGAVMNRLESTIANLSNVSENISASRSRIIDADIAQETSAMTKNNILQQAGVSVLAQANQTPQLALSLLQ